MALTIQLIAFALLAFSSLAWAWMYRPAWLFATAGTLLIIEPEAHSAVVVFSAVIVFVVVGSTRYGDVRQVQSADK